MTHRVITAAAASSLPNAGFYQSAAGLFGVLLLTGVVAEVRASRDRHDSAAFSRGDLVGLIAFALLSVAMLSGETAAMTVLLRQKSNPLLQIIVGVSLYLGLLGVPALAFSQVAQRASSAVARRLVLRVAAVTAAIAVAIAGAFVVQSQISGQPALGSGTRVLATGQIEGGDILRASPNGRSGTFADTLPVHPDSSIVLGLRVSNPGPDALPRVLVKVSLPNTSAFQLMITGAASSVYANPSKTIANVVTLMSSSRPICADYELGSTSLRALGQPGGLQGNKSLPDGVVLSGVEIGRVGARVEEGRIAYFRVHIRSVKEVGRPC